MELQGRRVGAEARGRIGRGRDRIASFHRVIGVLDVLYSLCYSYMLIILGMIHFNSTTLTHVLRPVLAHLVQHPRRALGIEE